MHKECEEEIVNVEPKKIRKRYPVVIPYIKDFSDQLRRTFKKYEVPAYFKPSNTLRQLLVRPKDHMIKESVVGPVYRIFFVKTVRPLT